MKRKLKKEHFWYGLLMISFIMCYFSTFQWLNHKYSVTDSYYSHGYLVPFIVIYLIYIKRDQLSRKPIQDPLGYALIGAALIVHVIAVMADINFISGYSILIYLTGVFLLILGRRNTKKIWFALFFLIFMFPIPNDFINYIGLPTKSMATDVGMVIIRLLDIPFYREGFQIQLTNTTLIVGTPCNGMKSLISFGAIGVLSLYLFGVTFKKSLLIILGIYPLSIILNGFRIAILVYIANAYGIEKASPESFFHDLSGIVVFLIGLVAIMVLVNFWKKKQRQDNQHSTD